MRWLVEQFTGIGLLPGNADGTFVQKVPLAGITPSPAEALTFTRAQVPTSLRWREDYVAFTSRVTDRVAIADTEVVFVGYGVQAPEFDWDDYKGADVKGKLLVMLVNDPPVPDPRDPAKLDDTVFGGRAMTYYGRWTYKYHIGAQLGAAGVLIVHDTERAGYPWGVVRGFSDERFTLRTPDRNMGRLPVEGWLTLDAARALFTRAGQDFDALRQRAATRAFAPVPLGTTAGVAIDNRLREVDSTNVIARLNGADPQRRGEYVVYTAHWDHLGVGEAVDGATLSGKRIGLFRQRFVGITGEREVAAAMDRLVRELQAAGASVVEVAIPDYDAKCEAARGSAPGSLRAAWTAYLSRGATSGERVLTIEDLVASGKMAPAGQRRLEGALEPIPAGAELEAATRGFLARREAFGQLFVELMARERLDAILYPATRRGPTHTKAGSSATGPSRAPARRAPPRASRR